MEFSSTLRYLIVSSKGSFVYYTSSADCNRNIHTYIAEFQCHQAQMLSFLFFHSLSKDWTMYGSRFDQTMNFNQSHIHCHFSGCEDLFQIRLPGIFKQGKEGKWKSFRGLATGLPGYFHSNYLGPHRLVNFRGLYQSSSYKNGYSEAFSYWTSADVLVLAICFGLHSDDLKSYRG